MAQCQADHKKHSTSRFDLYGGIFSGQLYGTSAGNGHHHNHHHMGHHHIDHHRMQQSCQGYNNVGGSNGGMARVSSSNAPDNHTNFSSFQENLSCGSFREDPLKASFGLKTSEAPVVNGGYAGNYSMPGLYGNGLDNRRRSTGGSMGGSQAAAAGAAHLTPEASPVSSKGGGGVSISNGAATRSPPIIPKEASPISASGTPPFHNHSRKSSGEISNDRKIIPPDGFSFGEIIKGVGNMCDQNLSSNNGGAGRHRKSSSGGSGGSGGSAAGGEMDGGSGSASGGGGSSKGRRSPRAESPKSIGSNSSGGSSSGESPTVGRIVNFGNILPIGGSVKNNGTSPGNGNNSGTTSVSGRGGSANGGGVHAPLPVPITGAGVGVKGNRRSNSWDYASGTLKASHGRSGSEVGGSGSGGVYTGANVGVNPKGSLSTSPSGSSSSAYGTNGESSSAPKPAPKAYGNIAYEGESILLRNSLSSMEAAEEVKNAGNEQYKKGHFTEALSLYDKAISLSPEKAPYRSNRAAALTGLGRIAEAVQECLQAVRLDPTYARAHHRLASLYLRLGLVDSATKHFKAAGTQVEWADTQRTMAIEKCLSKCNDARKAQDWQALIRETDAAMIAGADCAPQIIAFKAEALLKFHRPEEADLVMMNIRRFEDVLKWPASATTNNIVLLVQAHIDMALGRFDGAVLAAEKLAHCAPQDSSVTVLMRKARTCAMARKLGNQLFNAGRFAEATTAYGEGLEAAPGNAVLLCNRAACRSKLSQWEKAVEDCNAALVAQPNYTKALMRRAHSYSKMERWEDSLRDYEDLRRQVPGDAEVARALYEVQVAQKKSKGQATNKMSFGGEVQEVTTNDQFQEAITAPGLAVVEFSTRWSERCKEITPFVDELCKRYLSINFLKVDVDDLPYLAKLESVSFVPTFKIYKNGSKVSEIAGPTEQALERIVNQFSV